MSALILFGLVVVLVTLRQPLLIILLVVIGYAQIIWGGGQLTWIIEDMFVSLDKELILALPMFMLCGGVMTKGSAARRLIKVARALTGHMPGGLGVASIASAALFAAISGSSIVTMMAIGGILYPAMREAGYDKRFALGAIMSGGTLGIIIPPSIPLILYGLVTETSILDLFRAGIGPGLLLICFLIVYSVIINWKKPRSTFSWPFVWAALSQGIWALMMPVLLLGGIYSGLFSPTESAAVALFYAVIIETLVHREMTARDLGQVIINVAKLGGALFPLIAVALSLNLILIDNHVPDKMVDFVNTWITSPITFLIAVNILLLAVGAIMTTTEAILILAPILAPLAVAYGFDKIVFGVIMIVNLEIGLLTPPVGLNLIVAMSAFREKFHVLVRSAVPFVLVMIAALIVINLVPEIALLFL